MNKILPYAKGIAALVGSVCTALLGIYGPETDMGRILTVVAAVATAVVTWAIPNADPAGTHQEQSVQPVAPEPQDSPFTKSHRPKPPPKPSA